MNSQWLGRYRGSNSGLLVIDLDDMGTHFEGRAFTYDENPSLPSACAAVKTPDKGNVFHLCLDLAPVHPRTGDPATWDQVAPLFPANIVFPRRADINLTCDGEILRLSWRTDIETFGSAEIRRSFGGEPPEYQPLPEVTQWEQFKAYVNRLEYRRYIFRGQEQPWRLELGSTEPGGPIWKDFSLTTYQRCIGI